MTAELLYGPLTEWLRSLRPADPVPIVEIEVISLKKDWTEMTEADLGFLSIEERERLDRIETPSRKIEYWAGRRALARVRDRLTSQGVGQGSYSLSHSEIGGRLLLVAIGVGAGWGVGVDLEASSRAFTEKAAGRWTQPSEARWVSGDLGALGLWCVKEACFKAHSEGGKVQTGALVPQYEVSLVQAFDGNRDRLQGRAQWKGSTAGFDFLVLRDTATLICFALKTGSRVD